MDERQTDRVILITEDQLRRITAGPPWWLLLLTMAIGATIVSAVMALAAWWAA